MWHGKKFIWRKKNEPQPDIPFTQNAHSLGFFPKLDEKQNSAHYKSYCKGSLDEELAGIPISGDNLDQAEQVLAKRSCFQLGEKFPSSFSNLSN